MMCHLLMLLLFYLTCTLHVCNGIPISESLDEVPRTVYSLPGFAIFVISAAAILLLSYVVIGCVCCPNKNIKALTYQNGFPVSRLNENNSLQFENPTEFAIFPPHSAIIDLQPVSISYPTFDDKVTFEPLPDILPRKLSGQSAACSSRPAHFRALLKDTVSLHDWFDDPNSNFPRDQLQYLSELGCGWFGRVVEGEASHISNNEEKTAVVVKILREEASPSEHLHFLHEVRPFRDLTHPNVVRLLGRCLESDPFLLILEHSISDLKSYLIQQENRDILVRNGILLQMACNVAAGLRYLHENGFTHMDLAAHNCFVCSDFTVKVGDYGISFDRCRDDYYSLGDIALPIRWCSPETLLCTDATIETKEITKEANIWAFGIVLWEIFEFAKLPYEELTSEEVLQKVLIERSVQLPAPSLDFPIREELSLIMKECWKTAHLRPPMEKIEKFLTRLYNDRHNLKTLETSFEERWNALQPKFTEVKSVGSDHISLKFENDFSERSDSRNYSSDGERFSSFEMSYDLFSKNINGQLSPSLQVLNGSIDELTENDGCVSLGCERSASVTSDRTLSQLEDDQGSQVGDLITPEQISSAIRDLDLVLASQPLDASRQSTLQKHPQSSNDNINAMAIANSSFSNNSNIIPHDTESLLHQNILIEQNPSNELKALDNNYNELPLVSENLNLNDVILGSEIHTKENEKTNIKILQLSFENYELNCKPLEGATHILSDKEIPAPFSKNTDIVKQTRATALSSVPDIVIHESPSVFESSHDENENIVQDINNDTSPTGTHKPFRFVFKNESASSTDSKKEQTSGSQDTPGEDGISSGMVAKRRSHPLTSTPLKSIHDINLNYSSEMSNVFIDNDDSGNVLDTNSISEISGGKIDESPPKPNEPVVCSSELHEQSCIKQQIDKEITDTVSSNGTFYYEAPSSKSEVTFRILNSDDLGGESSASFDQDNFASAQSTFNVNNSNVISKTVLLTDGISDSSDYFQIPLSDTKTNGNVDTVIANIPTLAIEVENGCAFSLVEANSSDEDYKWPLFKKDMSDGKLDAFNEDHIVQNSATTSHEDILSLNYGEPVTPDVSINISSCSYDNEGRSYSISSPGVSSENIKDSESDFETSGSREIKQGVIDEDPSDTGAHHHSGRTFINDKYTDSNAIQNYPTLDSEPSCSELLDSYSPDVTSDSFAHSDENRMESTGNMRGQKSNFNSTFLNLPNGNKTDLFYEEDDDSESDTNAYKSKGELRLRPYDEVIVEDLETGEQTIITESFSACDDYENSAESDEILKINTETDEAIIVDSSEALIGFVPSRSIELLQECEMISTMNPSFNMDDEKELSDSNHFDASNSASSSPGGMHSNASPCESPDSTYPLHQPYRNFCLQNEVIEEEITDEITTPSSIHSTASFSSNEVYLGEEKMSQSSESYKQEDICETSVMPTVDHFYDESEDGCRTDDSRSECSPIRANKTGLLNNIQYAKDVENNHLPKEEQDVMYSWQPTQSVRWHSDDTLDIERDGPVVLEGREILAGGMLETRGMSVKEITTALNQLDVEDRLNRKTLDHLNVSRTPSPYSSVESSPCRDAYTPDFESDSEETGSGTSCSSTSGSFECIHNKFKNTVDISKVGHESEPSDSSREHSPLKIFSKTWDCHATPTRGVLVTPEKKFSSLRKSVSFHEEDPQVVFEYPPLSDSSEDGGVNENMRSWNIDYENIADWDLQAGESEEITEIEEVLEIEELDSEPYVRRPTYGIGSSLGPMNRPMLYSLTSGFSDDDMDLSEPTTFSAESVAPSNSPEEGKHSSVSEDQIGDLIRSQLNNLALEESRLKWMQDVLDKQSSEFISDKLQPSTTNECHSSVHRSENVAVVSEQDIVLEEMFTGSCESTAIQREETDFAGGNELIEKKLVGDSYPAELKTELVTIEGNKTESFHYIATSETAPDDLKCRSSEYLISDIFISKADSVGDCKYDFEDLENDGSLDVSNKSISNELQECHSDPKNSRVNENSGLIHLAVETIDNFHNICEDCIQPDSSILDTAEIRMPSNVSSDHDLLSPLCLNADIEINNATTDIIGFDTNNEAEINNTPSSTSYVPDCFCVNSSLFLNDDFNNATTAPSKLDNGIPSIIDGDQKDNGIKESSSVHSHYRPDFEPHNMTDLKEVVPDLDSLNSDLSESSPKVPLSTNECSLIEFSPLTLDEGNIRPNSLKAKVPYSEDSGFNLVKSDTLSTNENFTHDRNVDSSYDAFSGLNSAFDLTVTDDLVLQINKDKPLTEKKLERYTNTVDVLSEDCELTKKIYNKMTELTYLEPVLTKVTPSTCDAIVEKLTQNVGHDPCGDEQGDILVLANQNDTKNLVSNFNVVKENENNTESHSLSIQKTKNIEESFNLETKSSENSINNFFKIKDRDISTDIIKDKGFKNTLNPVVDDLINIVESAISIKTIVQSESDSNIVGEYKSATECVKITDNVPTKDSDSYITTDSNRDQLKSPPHRSDFIGESVQVENNVEEYKSVIKSEMKNIDHMQYSDIITDIKRDNLSQDESPLESGFLEESVLIQSNTNVVDEYASAIKNKIQKDDSFCIRDSNTIPAIKGDSLPESQLKSNTDRSDCVEESAFNSQDIIENNFNSTSKGARAKSELPDPLPKIVVTPASESEIEDELEEYLRDQLRYCHGPDATGDNFSVTSQYSVRPFEDVFGSYNVPGTSADYIEAFNFEFESGDFFEDFLDDYPNEVSTMGGGEVKQWESPNVPSMVERSSSEEDLMVKPESSPLYYASKDSTHL